MVTIYDVEVESPIFKANMRRLTSQTFALLPMREEGKDWVKPLQTIANEALGMSLLFPHKETLLSVAAKLQGLLDPSGQSDFAFYRRTIFECCNIFSKLAAE